MALRIDNNFGLFSGGSGGGGGGVSYVGAIGVNGISVSGSPITTCGTLGITNTAPYQGQAVVVVGSGTCSTLRCGVNNSASGNYSASLGGSFNCSSATNSIVVGGIGNNASGNNSFIGGGCYNCTTGSSTTIGGGICNFIKNTNGSLDLVGNVIGGGIGNNTRGGTFGTNSFTSQPTPSNTSCFTFIGGGFQNNAQTNFTSIGGGQQNIAIGLGSTILGGTLNCSVGNCSTIGGGQQNCSCGDNSTIVGGRVNTTKGIDNVIIGGCNNQTNSVDSVIGGGAINVSCNDYSFVGGGCNNCLCSVSGTNNTIGGGYYNRVVNISNNSFIGGGVANRTSDNQGSVVGGIMNVVGNSVLYNIASTNASSQIILFCGDVTSGISNGNCIYYYHPQDKVVYVGNVNSISYCSALGLTAISGTQLCAGLTNASKTYGRNATNESTSNSTSNFINGGLSNTTTSGQNNLIANGEANSINTGCLNSIVNGCCNIILNIKDSCNNTIQNGCANYIYSTCNSNFNTINNGNKNLILQYVGGNNSIGNGNQNYIGCCNSFGLITNGCSNILSGSFAFIGNGVCNNLYDVNTDGLNNYSQFASVVVNGVGNNTNSGVWDDNNKCWISPPTRLQTNCFSFIGNGFQNYIGGIYSSIVNGYYNNISSFDTSSFIGGGSSNTIASNGFSSIVGGANNQITGFTSFIGGGYLNIINASLYAVIGGGYGNCTLSSYSSYSFIGGGFCNYTNAYSSVIGGGCCNCIDNTNSSYNSFSSIVGGCLNVIYGDVCDSVIGGGCNNLINNLSQRSAILGGGNNNTNNKADVFIVGSNIVAERDCATYVNNLNITNRPDINNSVSTLGWDDRTCRVVLKTLGTGVSSVGLVMPPAFSVTNSPITTSGTICVVGAGLTSQYVRGDGQLATFPAVSGGGGGSVYYLNTTICSCAALGLKQASKSAVFPSGTNVFTNSGIVDGNPFVKFITDANDPNITSLPGGVWEYNAYLSVNSGNLATVRADVYKYCNQNGLFVPINTGATRTLTDGSTISLYGFTTAIPTTSFTTSDRFAIYFVAGNTSGNTVCLTTSPSRLAAVTTTIPSGISSLCGLSASSQFFTTTTSCNDFCITSSGCTHCFNLPNASATSRGIISTNDWNCFNSKQSTTYPANTFYVNPTTSTATATPALYCESGEISLPFACITQFPTNGAYPQGLQYYRWNKIGNLVNLSVYICFNAAASSGICGIEALLPSSVPIPTYSAIVCPSGCSPTTGGTIAVASSMFSNTSSFGGGVVKAALVVASTSPSAYSMCWILTGLLTQCRVYVANVNYIASSIS